MNSFVSISKKDCVGLKFYFVSGLKLSKKSRSLVQVCSLVQLSKLICFLLSLSPKFGWLESFLPTVVLSLLGS